MSLVIAIVGLNFYALAGDGRVINDGEIIAEDYKKVIAIGENAGIGFTGTVRGAIDSVEFLKSFIGKSVSFEQLFNTIYEGVKNNTTPENHVSLAVLGINKDNNFVIKTIKSKDNCIVNEYVPNISERVKYVILYNPDSNISPPEIFLYNLNKCKDSPVSAEDYLNIAIKTIQDVSFVDKTVNRNITKIYRER